MKKILLVMLLVCNHLCFAYPMPHPFPPFRIVGNLYYVGTDDLASYLVVTPKGNIDPVGCKTHIAQKQREFYEKLNNHIN